MCSIVEDDFGDDGGAHAMIEDPKTNGFEGEICKKCSLRNSEIKLNFKEPMCGTCFLVYVNHKFRASLGSTKIVRRHSNVLLHFTGRPLSVCLADMIRNAFEQESHKRLCFELEVVFVDENCVDRDNGKDPMRRLAMIQEVKAVLVQFPNFKCYYKSIAGSAKELLVLNDLSIDDVAAVIQSEEKFLSTFNSLKSLSAKQDMLATMRSNALRSAAISLKCDYIFLPDISITLATRLLTQFSLGRGSSAAHDVAFCDDRIEALKFIRPIKDLSEVEVLSYIKFNDLKCLGTLDYGDDHGQFASIQNMTSKFINDLQGNFSSTVSTVYRTCNKIAPNDNTMPVDGEVPDKTSSNSNISDMNLRCVMCKSFLDYHNSDTLSAIEFSRLVSESAGSEDLHNLNDIESRATAAVIGDGSRVRKHLCNGCRNIFVGLNDDEIEDVL